MASTYTLNQGIEKPGTGEQSGTWGNTTNTNFDIIDRALSGVGAISLTGTTTTLTTTDGSLTDGMYKVLVLGGSPSGTNTITIGDNTQDKVYFVVNNSGQEVIFTQGTGANATIANGAADIIYADGAGSGAAVASFFGTSLKIGTDLTIGGDSTFSGDTHTFSSANSTDPLLIIKNTTNDANGSRLHFVKDKGAAGADGDDIGTIEFISDDDGQNQTSFAKIVAEVSESANTDEAGKLSFFVAESDGTTTALTAGLVLEGEHATDGEVDVTIGAGAGSTTSVAGDLSLAHDGAILGFGADNDVTLTHSHNSGLILKNTNTGDDNPAVLVLQTGDTDIAQSDALGKLHFQAPDEGEGTDAVLVAASIEAFAEGNFAADNNATTLELATGRSAGAGSDGGRLRLSSAGRLSLKNQNTADNSFPVIALETGDTDIAQDDVLGRIVFSSPDEGAGVDAILVSAAIEAVSEGDFAANNNATELSFKTGASEAAVRRMTISSSGETTISRAGSRTDYGGLLRLNGTYSSANNGPNIMFHGTATDAHPSMQILNYSHNDISINFDAYYSPAESWISSDSNGNYQLVKRSDKMLMNRKSGVAAGSAVSWVEFMEASLDNGHMEFTANRNSVSHYLINGHGTTPYGVYLQFTAASPDNNDNYFLTCIDGGNTARLRIYSDGDVVNHDNSYGSTSDERLKQNIVDSNSQWDDIKNIKIRNFKKKDDVAQYGDNAWSQIGVIAQELETISPKLIRETEPSEGDVAISSDFGTIVDDTDNPIYYSKEDTIPDGKKVGDVKEYKKKVETKSTVKAVMYSVLYMKALKALQEAMARIETLESKVKALEDA